MSYSRNRKIHHGGTEARRKKIGGRNGKGKSKSKILTTEDAEGNQVIHGTPGPSADNRQQAIGKAKPILAANEREKTRIKPL